MIGRLVYFVPGVRTDVEDVDGWQYRAKRWVDKHTPHDADTLPYHTLASTRFVGQRDTAGKLGRILLDYDPDLLTLVCHSNGCALACMALRMFPALRILDLHLIAAAEDPDFERNGLNDAHRMGRIGSVTCYCSENDGALKLAGWSRFLLGWAGLGYGDLGRVGPRNVADADKPWFRPVVWRNDFGHSDWFNEGEGGYFETLMRRVVAA